VLLNIGQLLTVRVPTAAGPRRGGALRELGIITDAAVLCVAGKIVSVGKTRQALKDPWIKKHSRRLTEIDCAGRVVLPGFVDSHTHPVFIMVGGKLIRASKRSAEWCRACVDKVWEVKSPFMRESERPAAAEAFDHARKTYDRIIDECEVA